MKKILIITKSKTFEIEKHPEKGYILKNENKDPQQKMHWMYLICGGFIIGTLCSVFIGSLWLLSFKQRQQLIVDISPEPFIKKCWGYW